MLLKFLFEIKQYAAFSAQKHFMRSFKVNFEGVLPSVLLITYPAFTSFSLHVHLPNVPVETVTSGKCSIADDAVSVLEV